MAEAKRHIEPSAQPPNRAAIARALLAEEGPLVEALAAKARFSAALGAAIEPLFGVLAPSKIVNARYGTRCSTVFLRQGNKTRYAERSFSPDGEDQETLHYEF